jgi:hypothetical protein
MLEGLTPPVRKNYVCKVDFYLSTLKSADVEILRKAVENQEAWPARTLSDQLKTRGVSIADTTITRHRRALCACYRADAEID